VGCGDYIWLVFILAYLFITQIWGAWCGWQ